MDDRKTRICPVEKAGSLDNQIRRLLQNPERILGPYVREGMIVLDLGCGPGFFSIDMAHLVGESGRVIAADLQEEMLSKVRDKISGQPIEKRIILHRCGKNTVGINEKVDFVLLFYMVHEVADKDIFFAEIMSLLRANGRILMVEPPFHVSRSAFEKTVKIAESRDLAVIERPKIFLSKSVLLQKK